MLSGLSRSLQMPLFPLRRIPSFSKPGQSLLSRFSPLAARSFASRRFFYGYISDSKMAPQLEPFFKQYVSGHSLVTFMAMILTLTLLGLMLRPGLSSIVSARGVVDLTTNTSQEL